VVLEGLRRITSIYPDIKPVARRMFVTNSFDSILASLGVAVGGYSSTVDPFNLALSIAGGGLAMGVFSGMVGVYLSERAERLKEITEMEKKLASTLQGTIYWKAAKLATLYVALWSGLGVVVFPLLMAMPLLLASVTGTSLFLSVVESILIGLASMAFLGFYLGKIGGENPLVSSIRAVSMGVGGILLVSVFKFFLGFLS
jgi:predicted membrane protein (TIGR00267 family)